MGGGGVGGAPPGSAPGECRRGIHCDLVCRSSPSCVSPPTGKETGTLERVRRFFSARKTGELRVAEDVESTGT